MQCDLGIFVNCPHPEMIESIAIAGFDFVVVDMEHSPLSPSDLYPMILAAERRNLSLVVRIPEKHDSFYKWCGDLGVRNIQVPHIQNEEDVKLAIRSYFFSPLGHRGLSRFVRSAEFSAMPKEEFLFESNRRNRLILQIEGEQAVRNLPNILNSVPAEASIFVGPYDLSQSLGIPGQIWDHRVVSTMESVISLCMQKGIRIGTFTDTIDGLEFWAKRGLNFIEFASDLNVFIENSKNLVAHFRSIQEST